LNTLLLLAAEVVAELMFFNNTPAAVAVRVDLELRLVLQLLLVRHLQ
jgi:hypothetical protein